MVSAAPGCQRSHRAQNPSRPPPFQPGIGNRERRHGGIERTMTSTLLGMLMMLPVVFGISGYVLVSRRP
ncbi:hypothetical protein A5692_01320 [Mycobacterium sp. E342]|nr:hypothetical protein A5692_01320 [Mycobacterium sp. E342]